MMTTSTRAHLAWIGALTFVVFARPAFADGHLSVQGGTPFRGSILVNVLNERKVAVTDVMVALSIGHDSNTRYVKTGSYNPPDDSLDLVAARAQDAQRSRQLGRTVTDSADQTRALYKSYAPFNGLAPGTYTIKVGVPGSQWSAPVQVTVTDVEPAWNVVVTTNSKTKRISQTVSSYGKTPAADPISDPTLLAGNWTVATSTELSTCATDPGGNKSANVWTLSATNGQIQIKSNSGAVFTGRVDTGSRSLVVWPVSAPSSVITQLTVQDARTLTGRQAYALATKNAADPSCAVYRTITATKQ